MLPSLTGGIIASSELGPRNTTRGERPKGGVVNSRSRTVVPLPDIIHSIVVLRGHKVLLDAELAALYDVTTKALNQAVNRNAERFPEDFMFRLSRTGSTL
ncbi:MAG: ORF6N domain-containing protein [Steroidobacteraceae bacterium]